ncbi:tryptophan-rich sensory protein [Clostridium estertheticum]|uniref:tryptophan-rich sensory protein n=1 Tax=Clostridium estertheticum TaxID=238834 RepID=UPI001C6E452D|nr:tryptophan-rich sensory protein [Clostridium estertheticum]MBW9171746.1 tryptophan-rich sensory protein [Clostridium estertheticum]WLC75920.1 tryptophan-rich sensory protein [Clostridium estertheticum]
MENVQKPKVGAGIKTMSIIQLIISFFGLWSIKSYFVNNDKTNAALRTLNLPEVTNLSITIGLVFSIILAVSVILILKKKELGIYIYFITVVANIAYSIVSVGFNLLALVSLIISVIMAVLMGIFIWKKKEIFSTETKNIEAEH